MEVQVATRLTGSNTPSDSSGGSQTSGDTNKEEREKILAAYNDGVGLLNDGTRQLDSAISAFNDDRLDESMSSTDDASTNFEDAESNFSTAVNTALRIGHGDATQLSQDAQEYALHMQLAAQYSFMAADSAKKGNTDQANQFVQKHRDEYEAAQKLGVRNPPVLKDVLNL